LCAHLAAPSRLVMAAGQRLAPGAVQPEPGRRGSLDRGHRDTGAGTPGPHWSGQVVTGTGRSESVAGPSPVYIQGSVLGRSLGPNFEHHEAHDEGQANKTLGSQRNEGTQMGNLNELGGYTGRSVRRA
jgi:hypothetical protein